MTAAIAKWRTRSGIRRTSPTDTLSVDVEAWTSLMDTHEGGIEKVSFSVIENGGAPTVHDVTAPSLRFPNYSDQTSPIYDRGGMAPLWAYGITLDCSVVAAGTIEVTAEVHSQAGTVTALPGSVVLYNDSDGTDRRPSTKRIYVSPTGSDSNTGASTSDPLLSIMRGVLACRANPAGSTSADFDAGGAELVLMPGDHQWARGFYSAPSWHTSGDWWLTVTAQTGARILRDVTAGTVEPDHYVTCTGYSGGTCRLHFIGGQWQASGGVLYCSSGVSVDAWMDGATVSSSFYTSGYSVRFREDSGQALDWGGPGLANGRRFMSCTTLVGLVAGPAGWTDLQDVRISNFLGLAMSASGYETEGATNLLIEHQRYDDEVAGHVAFAGGAQWSVSIPSGGLMRIDATAPQATDIAVQLAEIAGTTYWGVKCSGFDSAGNNSPSSAAFPVVSVGTNISGFPYVVLENAAAVPGPAGASARMDTARYDAGAGSVQTYHELVHPDLLQWNANRTGTLHSNVAVRDVKDAQAWFAGGHTLTRCALVNVSDGGGGLRWNMASGASLVDCLFFHCSTTGPWDFTTLSGCEFVNCVISSGTGLIATGGNIVQGCHFIAGPVVGSDTSSGPWYNAATASSPWHLTPSSGSMGTASSILSGPTEYRFPGAADSRGVWKNVAQFDWSISSSPSVMAGLAPAAVRLGAAATGALIAGALLSGSAPAAISVTAPSGSFSTFGGAGHDAEFTGPAPAALSITSPTGALLAQAVLEGNAPAALSISAPTATLVAHALLSGDAPAAITTAAPTGALQTTVLFSGPAPDRLSIGVPSASFLVPAVLRGPAPAALTVRAPTAALSVPTVETVPVETSTGRRFPREPAPNLPRRPRRRWFA